MKTPEEIKKGILHCVREKCKGCPYYDKCMMADAHTDLHADALEYIQQLENYIGEFTEKVAQLDQVTRERDAMLEIVKELGECAYCKHDSYCTHTIPDCMNCKNENCQCYSCSHRSKWQWRGEQEGER